MIQRNPETAAVLYSANPLDKLRQILRRVGGGCRGLGERQKGCRLADRPI
jgi:hypothetical protein